MLTPQQVRRSIYPLTYYHSTPSSAVSSISTDPISQLGYHPNPTLPVRITRGQSAELGLAELHLQQGVPERQDAG